MSTGTGKSPLLAWENDHVFCQHSMTGGSHAVAANRINFFYDTMGPSLAIESGSVSAVNNIHIGILSLWNNECKMVIAGGANVIWVPHFHISRCQTGNVSQNGQARPFDKDSDGTVQSEGCGVVIMKSLHDAIRDGDHIHCIIRGTVRGYHGESPDMTVNTVEPIYELMTKLYKPTGISLDKVDYVETSASGKPKEDILEAEVISRMFRARKNAMKIGSCIANIGHTEHASGMASLIKCSLMLSNREYYPQANFNHINSGIPATKWKLEIQEKYEKYDQVKPMLIGLNSISTTGHVIHMLLEEYKKSKLSDVIPEHLSSWYFGNSDEKGKDIVIVLSSKDKAATMDMARRWLLYKNINQDAQIVASWLALKRNHYNNRLVVIANSGEDFRDKIRDFIDGKANKAVFVGNAPRNFRRPKICFVFPGHGQQWQDMGRSLYANEPIYRNTINKCDEIWKIESGYSFVDKFNVFVPLAKKKKTNVTVDDIIVCQPAIVAHQLALSSLLKHWGIEPDMVIGHSLGEVSAACIAGTLTVEECIIGTFHRATSVTRMSGKGTMAAGRFTPEEGHRFCERYDKVYLACYNSPDSVTLSGDKETIVRLTEENPKLLKILRVTAPYHTIMMKAIRDDYIKRMEGKYVPKISNNVKIYSTLTKGVYLGPHGADYWWNNIASPVFFLQANEAIFNEYGNDVIFVEIAAAPILLSCIRQTAKKLDMSPAGYISFGTKCGDDWAAVIRGLVQLYVIGFPINWRNFTHDCAQYVDLPIYPFQRKVFSLETEQFKDRLLGLEDKSYIGRYGQIDVQMHPFLADCRFNKNIVMPVSGWVEYFTELANVKRPCLRDIIIINTPKIPEMNILGQYEKLHVEAVVKGDKFHLQANTQNWNLSSDQPRGIYATATLSAPNPAVLPMKICINPINNRCTEQISRRRIYEKLSHVGWEYGDSFRTVKEIRVNEKEAIGILTPEVNRYERIKTISLDGAFQVAQVSFAEPGVPHKIARIGRVQLCVDALPLKESFYVYAKITARSLYGFSVNIYITDIIGNVLAILLGCYFESQKYECQKSLSPNIYYLNTEEIVQHYPANRKNWMNRNHADRHLGLIRLRDLNYVKVKGWKYDIRDLLFVGTKHILKFNEVQVMLKAVTEAGNIIHCCGIVSQVGRDVSTWKTGDRVLSLLPSTIHSQQIFLEDDLVSIKSLSWKEGSGVCLTYCIAFHVVNNLLMVKANDNVYINDCTSITGKACAWMAHVVGARIMSKRSGNIPFVKTIDDKFMSRNNGGNLDVIISPGVWKSNDKYFQYLSDQSRICFISYGSDSANDTFTNENIIIHNFEVRNFLSRRPNFLRNDTMKIINLIETGRLPKLMTISNVSDIDQLDMPLHVYATELPDDSSLDVIDKLELTLDSLGTYLVSGDYNSITFSLISWLIRHGAKHIYLVCRPKKKEKCQVDEVKTLQENGICLYQLEVDLSCEGQLQKLCDQLETMGAPVIRGLWHIANVGFNPNPQNRERLSQLIHSDVIFARTLLKQCNSLHLDFLVMLSTAGFLRGKLILDQAAVAKEHASLAEERKLSRLPALSITVYPVKEDTESYTFDDIQKCDILAKNNCMEVMEMLLLDDDPPAAVAIVDQVSWKLHSYHSYITSLKPFINC